MQLWQDNLDAQMRTEHVLRRAGATQSKTVSACNSPWFYK